MLDRELKILGIILPAMAKETTTADDATDVTTVDTNIDGQKCLLLQVHKSIHIMIL